MAVSDPATDVGHIACDGAILDEDMCTTPTNTAAIPKIATVSNDEAPQDAAACLRAGKSNDRAVMVSVNDCCLARGGARRIGALQDDVLAFELESSEFTGSTGLCGRRFSFPPDERFVARCHT